MKKDKRLTDYKRKLISLKLKYEKNLRRYYKNNNEKKIKLSLKSLEIYYSLYKQLANYKY